MEIKKESTCAATTPACAYNGNSSSSTEFDVFLSFRGPDTRLTFADCLYHFLHKAGIRVFRDDEEIRKGERIGGELLRAIETSKIYVPIFSENYASSAWCLRELTHMLECVRRAEDKVIIPIFCGVKTDDVKLKSRLYLDALDKHEEEGRFDVQQWKNALIEAARFKGWDLQGNGYGEISIAVLDEVSTRLKKRRRNLPDHLVGIDDQVQTILNLLNEGPHDVRYLVIHGMGGIGKTTLASAVYNHIFDQFQVRSFLWDVRESTKNRRIIDLQKKLLSELCQGRSPEICDSVDGGINIIRERFRDKKVLLVLDDVNNLDQLSKLVGKSDSFGPGSKIIITTRDINFLPEENKESCFQASFGEFKIYEMREMDSSHALQLFSKHAFKKNFPPHDFYDISCEITSKAGGLPLALEVIGSSLLYESKKSWEKTLKKLHFVPKEKVLNRLEIGYDMLKPHQKEMFLDIACFFIGKERLSTYYMWKASKHFQASEVLVLARMSLIKIKENDILWMHDLLRDLGREIVEREDKFSPEMRSRLWEHETAFKVVWKKEGTHNVVALRLRGLSQEHDFTGKQFSKLPNLRFLELEGGNLVGNFENLLSKLRWLSWSDCPAELSATNLCLEDLVVLELSGSNITEDWNGWGPCLVSENLKVIRITQCPSLRRTPDFSKCLNLKKLVIQGCTSMVVVDGSHTQLEDLKLTNSVGGIESSLQLDLSGTGTTELLASNGNSKNYPDESERRELPKAITMLEDIELEAQFWGDMKGKIPRACYFQSFNHVTPAERAPDLKLTICCKNLDYDQKMIFLNITRLFIGIQRPDSYFFFWSKLDSYFERKTSDYLQESGVLSPAPMPFVKAAENANGALWIRFEDLGRYCILLKFKTYTCSWLLKLETAFGVIRMKELDPFFFQDSSLQHPIKCWPSHLQILRLDQCGQVEQFPELPVGLKELTFSSHLLWTALDLSYLTNLVDLQVRRNTFQSSVLKREAPKIEWVEGLSNLKRLTIDVGDVQCPQINWASLSRLQSSVMIHWHNVLYIRGVVRDSELLERLSVSRLKRLNQLSVFACPGLIKTQGVEKLKSRKALFIHRCSSFERLPDLSKFKKLRQLNLAHCPLQHLPDLHLPDKCRLMVEGCEVSSAFDGAYEEQSDTLS